MVDSDGDELCAGCVRVLKALGTVNSLAAERGIQDKEVKKNV